MQVMKQILQNCYDHFETIKIRQNTPTLEYLKKIEKYRFVLKQVNHEQFLELQKKENLFVLAEG